MCLLFTGRWWVNRNHIQCTNVYICSAWHSILKCLKDLWIPIHYETKELDFIQALLRSILRHELWIHLPMCSLSHLFCKWHGVSLQACPSRQIIQKQIWKWESQDLQHIWLSVQLTSSDHRSHGVPWWNRKWIRRHRTLFRISLA